MLKQAIDAGKAAAASQALLDEAEGVSLGCGTPKARQTRLGVFFPFVG